MQGVLYDGAFLQQKQQSASQPNQVFSRLKSDNKWKNKMSEMETKEVKTKQNPLKAAKLSKRTRTAGLSFMLVLPFWLRIQSLPLFKAGILTVDI